MIRSVKDFGAFVDLGGVDGLIHVGDMSWSRVSDVGDLVKIGPGGRRSRSSRSTATTQKVSLGLKQLMPSPWDDVEDRFARGETVQGKVTRLMDFGTLVGF